VLQKRNFDSESPFNYLSRVLEFFCETFVLFAIIR
jgi:hypothetical protein